MSLGRAVRPAWVLPVLLIILTGAAPGRAPAAPAATWTPMENLSASNDWSYSPQIVADPSTGDLWVIWTEDLLLHPLRDDVLLRRRLGSSGTWTATLNLSDSPDRDGGGELYLDDDGVLHAVWTRRNGAQNSTDLIYRRRDGSGWSGEQVIDHSPAYHPTPYALFFVEDPADRLCLFVSEGAQVTHTCLEQGTWDPLAPWTNVFGMQILVEIILGPDGRFHVGALGPNEYQDIGACDPDLNDAYYTTTDGTTWDPLVNLSYFGSTADDVALAFDASGRLHFLWSDIKPYCSLDSVKSTIYERVLDGSVWGVAQEIIPDNAEQVVLTLDLLVEDGEHFHLTWDEGVYDGGPGAQDLSIRYCSWANGVWGDEEFVRISPERSRYPSLALHLGTTPVVVWAEGPALEEEVGFSQREIAFMVFLPLLEDAQVDGPNDDEGGAP